MILDVAQIKSIILTNPTKDLIAQGRNYSKKMQKHLYGKNLEKSIEAIAGYERDELRNLRAKYSRSNKDLFSRLARPIDKIFSARGGSIYYNLSDSQEKAARAFAGDVKDGVSVRKWVEMHWKQHMLDDPFGAVLMEILPMQEAIINQQAGKSFVYPTYLSIACIYDYKPKGNRFDYIVIELDNSSKAALGFTSENIAKSIYRVIDDAFDYIVEKVNDSEIRIYGDLTIQNYFGQVPAMRNSDIIDPQVDGAVLSFFDDAVELADHYFINGSIKITHKFMHGFPKYAEYADSCSDCKGTGYQGANTCKSCGGSGLAPMIRVDAMKMLTWPGKDEPIVSPKDVAAYISPDKTFHDISTQDQQLLEDMMNVTIWGTQSRLQTQGMAMASDGTAKTATQVMDEVKPQSDRLQVLSDMAEQRHKFILDAVIQVCLPYPMYPGASVSYGRRYMLESPDQIWLNYSDARVKGSPQSVLDELLSEYYEAKYQSNPIGLAKAKKLMYVEPFVHMTALQLRGLGPDPADYAAKLYYSEWLSEVTDAAILAQDVTTLRAQLYAFAGNKKPIQQTQQPAPAA